MRYFQIGLLLVLVVTFGAAGLTKLVSAAIFYEQFAHFGLPGWIVYLTGAVELSGAALIASFDETRRRLGAAMLAITMAVATSLHLLYDPFALALPAFLLMLIAGGVALVPLRKHTGRAPAGA